jgi:hypothetical protein
MSLTVYLNGSGTIKNCKCCKTLTFSSVVITDSAEETMTPQQFVEYGQSLPCNPCGSVMVNCKKYNLKITNSKIVNNKLVLWLSKNCKLPTGYCKSVKVTMLPCESSNSELYGVINGGYYYDTQQLVKINQQTGDITIIGDINVSYYDSLTSIIYDKCTKTLYGVVQDNNSYSYQGSSYFAKIDLSTGNTTIIGEIGFSVWSMAINSKGEIYATPTSGNLYTINKNTGAGTQLTNVISLSNNYGDNMSISFNNNNNNELYLYNGNGIYKYDIITQTITFIFSYSGTMGSFKPCTNDYYGVDPYYGGSPSELPNVLYGINVVTGVKSELQLNVPDENTIANVQFI